MPELLHKSPDRPHWPGPLRIVGAGAYAATKGKDFPAHHHATWELVYYREGHIECPIGNEMYRSRPGTLLATPPMTTHAELATTPYSNFYITIDAPADVAWPRVHYDDADGLLGALCAATVREWLGAARDREQMLCLMGRQIDLLLRRAGDERQQSHRQRLVAQAKRIIEERYASPITARDLARTVGCSESSLRAHFTGECGQSPMAYLRTVRQKHALSLLRHSTLTLESIAALCGYDSASHLSRNVKQITGVRPGMLRIR